MIILIWIGLIMFIILGLILLMLAGFGIYMDITNQGDGFDFIPVVFCLMVAALCAAGAWYLISNKI